MNYNPFPDLSIDIFLDTNILRYLVENTYPLFTQFYTELQKSPFVRFVSAEFCLYEFIMHRKIIYYKNEHLIDNHKKEAALKAKGCEISKESVTKIINEIEMLNSKFDISISHLFHPSLLSIFKEVFLKTKVSNSDGLILVSSIIPDKGNLLDRPVFMTCDRKLCNYISIKKADIIDIFKARGHMLIDICSLSIKAISPSAINLTKPSLPPNITIDILIEKLLKKFLGQCEEFNSKILGITSIPKNLKGRPYCCFKAKPGTKIPPYVHIIFMKKNMKEFFVIQEKKTIWSSKALKETFVATSRTCNFSFEISEYLGKELYDDLKDEGHYILIHPDDI